jgi:Fic family protein
MAEKPGTMTLEEAEALAAGNAGRLEGLGLDRCLAGELDGRWGLEAAYASNALSGSPLTLEETGASAEGGASGGGRGIRHVLEAAGHAEAWRHMLKMARSGAADPLSEAARQLHLNLWRRVTPGEAGEYRTGPPRGGPGLPAPPAPPAGRVARLMAGRDAVHAGMLASAGPMELAAHAHQAVMGIRPFAGGNGRVARLLMNLMLVRGGLVPVSFPPEEAARYREAVLLSLDPVPARGSPLHRLVVDGELKAQGRLLEELAGAPGGAEA